MNQSPETQDYRSLMRDALLELRQMRAKVKAFEDAKTEPIAIVGIGCRFPGNVESPADFWQLLRTGQDAITEVPADRWQNDRFYDADPDAPGKISTRYGGFVNHLQDFDAEFFGIADREAMSLDPQQRLLLEVSWEALEQAGIIPEHLAGSTTGVFVGISSNDYSQHLLSRDRREIDAYLATGNSHSTAAGRLSYTLGLTGPSLAVDTACSSSLVAVHLACQSLRQQECSLALVGGVNRLLSPDFSINFSKAHMLSPDGRCKTFDARADGFVRAEGCGVVVLKRLSDAVAAGNQIWALIRGSAVNQDGRSSGLTVPNGPVQQAVVRQALANAAIDPAHVSYLEAHGTGTALGDPIELLALGAVFGASNPPLTIGSVKTNLGHLEAAAGIAGLIKVALSLHHQEIPPHLHFQQPNPHVPWEKLSLQISTRLAPWKSDLPRIAGVSSFGFSGTNAHVVLSAADVPVSIPQPLDSPPYTLTLSAKTPAALQALARRYYDYLRQHPELCFADVCNWVRTGRSQFAERLSITANSTVEAVEKLAVIVNSRELQPSSNGNFRHQADALHNLEFDSRYYQQLNNQSPSYLSQKLILPTYLFQRRRYWVDIDDSQKSDSNRSKNHPLLGEKLFLSRSQDVYFSHHLSQTNPDFLAQHRVLGAIILPASGYIEMALAAGKQVLQSDCLSLQKLTIQQPIVLSEAEIAVQVVLTPSDHAYRFEILSATHSEWQLHASGLIGKAESSVSARQKPDCPETVNLTDYYQTLQTYGIEYGNLFQAIQQLWRGDHQALGRIELAEALTTASYQCHPVLLDAAFQVIGVALPKSDSSDANNLYLPIGCDCLTLYKRPERNCWSYVTVNTTNSEQLTANLQLTDAAGEIIAVIEGLHLRKAQRLISEQSSDSWRNWLYQINWQAQPFPMPTPTAIHEQPVASTDVTTAPQSPFIASAEQTHSNWLIFTDRHGLGQQLANRLPGHVTLVQTGETYRQDAASFTINPRCRADFEQLWAAIPPPHQILYLWGLDSPTADLSLESLTAATETTCTSLLYLLQTLQSSPTLWLVTQGAVTLHNETNAAGLSQSPIWGLGKVIALEYPALHCRCLDLDSSSFLSEQVTDLERELQSASGENQIAIRNHHRYVARLERFELAETLPLPEQPFRLACLTKGTLDQLTLQLTERHLPDANQVEIRVYATGLNLIDVLDTLNLLPFERNWFGVECAGKITAVGSEVTDFQVGDAVVALAAGSFSQYVTVDAALVAPKPAHLSFTEAATIPAAFLTADYALRLANLQAGERILIHAAATGTGMAAVMLAQQIGAEIYATASPGKWKALKAMGVKHIMNSRTLEFAEQIMTLTQGKGVDVVFNSLSGEFIPASLSVLSDTGRFLEIGKRQVWSAAQVAEAKPKAAYHLIDLMAIAQQQPSQIQARLSHLMQSGISPLPQTIFPMQKVVQAFRTMQQAQHIGKIVVTQSQSTLDAGQFSICSDGTYLITGGLGGLGLLVAEWLIQRGAQHLVLVSRSHPASQTQKLQTLEQSGAQVEVVQADVAIQSQIASVIESLKFPLCGVFHAAGVLDDGIIQQLTWERISNVIAPKLAGAWNLHYLTQNQPLDCFVLFSSAAALLGSPGQASHVAANTFLDALAHYRQANGQPGLSINWGAWSEVGSAAQRQVDQQMQMRGVGSIPPQTGLHVLEMLLEQSAAQVGVIPIRWNQFLQQGDPAPFFSTFHQVIETASQSFAPSQILSQLSATHATERLTLLTTYLQTEVGKVLGLPTHRLPKPDQGFFDLGMDSLMAVELKNRLETQLNLSLTTTTIFEHSTIRELAQHLAITLMPAAQSSQEESFASTENLRRNEQPSYQDNFSKLENLEHEKQLKYNVEVNDVEANILNELNALESLLKEH